MKRRSVLLGIGVAVLSSASACIPRVQLPSALPLSAPFEDRAAMYAQHRPRALQTLIFVGQNGSETRTHRFRLANGVEVFDGHDLLPMVNARSAFARSIEEADADERTVIWVFGSSLVLGGIAGLLGWGQGQLVGEPQRIALRFAIGVGVVGGVTFAVGGHLRANLGANRGRAFELFDQDLRNGLGLCLRGTFVHDCALAGSVGARGISTELPSTPSRSSTGDGSTDERAAP
jgi:hypothetical protein